MQMNRVNIKSPTKSIAIKDFNPGPEPGIFIKGGQL